jgi:DNA-binding MarR family transcriptional regulator
MTDSIDRLVRGLRRISHALSIHSKQTLETHRVTMPQLVCLMALSRKGAVPLSALTEPLALNNSTVTGIVDRLERRGMVRRVRLGTDRRRVHVELTSAGERFLATAPPPVHADFIDRLQTLSPGEIETLLWAIETLAEMLSASGPIEKGRP